MSTDFLSCIHPKSTKEITIICNMFPEDWGNILQPHLDLHRLSCLPSIHQCEASSEVYIVQRLTQAEITNLKFLAPIISGQKHCPLYCSFKHIVLRDDAATPGPIWSTADPSEIPRRRFTDNSSRAEQLSRTALMPLAPKVQDPHESFFNPLQFFAKTPMPASVNSRQARSLRRVRFLHPREMMSTVCDHQIQATGKCKPSIRRADRRCSPSLHRSAETERFLRPASKGSAPLIYSGIDEDGLQIRFHLAFLDFVTLFNPSSISFISFL
ncbi:unnamed protein product, partial [Vitis vinifera]